MRKHLYFVALLLALLSVSLSCNLPVLSRAVPELDQEQAIASAVAAELDSGMNTTDIQPPPQTEAPPSQTPTFTETPTVTPTFTPSVPIARVSRNTNCRTGPGTEYDLVYIFMVGDEAEIIARSSVPNYVIIKVPDGSGRNCWLWMQYGEQSGDTSGLPQQTPPPTPTPEATATPALGFTLTHAALENCLGKVSVFIGINNTGSLKIESRSLDAKNQNTSETVTNQVDTFGASAACLTSIKQSINPGEWGYVSAPFTPPIAGHTIKVNINACHGDGMAGPCYMKSIAVEIPNVSDVSLKEDFQPVDTSEILRLITGLPITAWSYRDDGMRGRHIGPMAQDFNQAFGVGDSDAYIYSVDANGVALAGLQALSEVTDGQAERIARLEASNRELREQNTALATRMENLERQHARVTTWMLVLLGATAAYGLRLALLSRRRT